LLIFPFFYFIFFLFFFCFVDWAVTTDVDLVPGKADAACPRDGAISMDVLASCRMALGRRTLAARCGP
jgi:hypothetical protein